MTLALIFDLAQIDTIPVVVTSAEDRLGQPRQRNRSRGILTHPGRPLALREQGLLIPQYSIKGWGIFMAFEADRPDLALAHAPGQRIRELRIA